MDPQLILVIVQGVLAIVRRHAAEHNGEILTDERVHNALMAELKDGQSQIALWFEEHDLPLPD